MEKYLFDYKKDLTILDKTIENSLIVSNLIGDIQTTEKINYAHRLYSKLLLTSMSILKLCPFSRLHITGEIWDFFSIANLTRSSMENYAVFHYLGIEQVDEEEAEFRIKLLYYHKNCELYKFYKELDTSENELEKLGFEEGLPLQKKDLSEHSFFKKITDSKKRNEILNGKVSLIKKQTEILNTLNLKNIQFKAFYRFYSNQTHSSPLGYFTMSNDRGRGDRNETEVTYIAYAIDIINSLLISATHHIIEILPESKKRIPKTILEYFEGEFKKL